MTATRPLFRAVDTSLVVAEVYGKAWQGEGPSAGTRCAFVRLGGCNLTCGWRRTREGLDRVDGAWACDEAKTWHSGLFDLRQTLDRMDARDVAKAALAARPPLVVVTGGEPLLHQDQPGWPLLLDLLLEKARVEVETNGTLVPAHAAARLAFNVSPKLASSGLLYEDRIVAAALEWHANCTRSRFKFVVQCPEEVTEAARLADLFGVDPRRMWIMPEGVTAGRVLEVARQVAPAVLAAGFNLTLRQHVLIYGEAGEPRD